MNPTEARQRVKDEFALAADLMATGDVEPEVMREMVDNVIGRYNAYLGDEIENIYEDNE